MSIIQGTKVIASRATNGFSLFDYKHADHLLNNVSWLRSDTFSWQSGNVYKYAYQHLLDEANKIAYYIPSITEEDTGTVYYTWKASNGKYYATLKETPVSGDTIYGYDKFGNVTMAVSETLSSISAEKLTLSNGAILYRARDTLQIDVIDDIEIPCFIAEDKHKICLPDQENNIVRLFNATGAADYYIVDKINRQFKLPRKNKRKLIRSWNSGYSWYRLYSDGWVEQGGKTSPSAQNVWVSVTLPITMKDQQYAVELYPTIANSNAAGFGSQRIATACDWNNRTTSTFQYIVNSTTGGSTVASNWTVKGYAHDSEYLDVGMDFEYYYVGNFEATSIEQTAGLNKELLNGKLDSDLANLPSGYDFVVDWQAPTAANSYTWYRKYKSGWVEQGGLFTNTARLTQITFPIKMADTNYSALSNLQYGSADWSATVTTCIANGSRTTTGLQVLCYYNNSFNTGPICWEVKGFAA